MVILLRWVLIIATSYLVLFSRPLNEVPAGAALFIAGYLASNLFLSMFLRRTRRAEWLDQSIILFDIVAVGVGLALTENGSVDFFPVYFLVIFVGALTERIGLVVGAAALIGLVHLSTLSRFVSFDELLNRGYALRIPFLFVVALFLSSEVKSVRSRKREARVRARKRMRMESLSAVTHDLKNPLGVVQSLAVLLLEGDAGPLSADQAKLVRRIHANVRRVLQLSTNLLDVARIEAGRVELRTEPTSLAQVVDDALAVARSAAEIKGVTLQASSDGGLPLIDVDPLQMERVVSNLLDNAIKYTPAGGKVDVTTRNRSGALTIEVRDTGPGIPPEEVPLLFEQYQRRAATSSIEGSGLGLFIVKAIVQAHGGTLEVRSQLGEGTKVIVRLELSRPPARFAQPISVREQRAWRWPFWATSS